MKNLEQKILKKIYQYETKKTLVEVAFETISFVFLVSAVIIFSQTIIEILNEQKSLDFLQLFGEDFEVIRKYFLDTIFVFYTEIPKFLMIIFLLFLSVLIYLILKILRNYRKIKNRVISLLKFWSR